MNQKTHVVKAGDIQRAWWVVDAEGQTLGRLAARIAAVLRGKHKPTFSRHMDVGDFVIVINADKVKVTGQKLEQKMYHSHSGYPGGLKTRSLQMMLDRQPTRVLEYAVRGMLPKNTLGEHMYKKLKVYAGPNHPHEAQQPKELTLA